MALTKATANIWNAQTLTAGAGDTSSSWIDVRSFYSVSIAFRLTNGATGPTIPGQIIVQWSPDNGTTIYQFAGAFIASVTNSAVSSWVVTLPPDAHYFRLVAGSNTAQNVTAQADYTDVSAI